MILAVVAKIIAAITQSKRSHKNNQIQNKPLADLITTTGEYRAATSNKTNERQRKVGKQRQQN
jgi:hypothetical protein